MAWDCFFQLGQFIFSSFSFVVLTNVTAQEKNAPEMPICHWYFAIILWHFSTIFLLFPSFFFGKSTFKRKTRIWTTMESIFFAISRLAWCDSMTCRYARAHSLNLAFDNALFSLINTQSSDRSAFSSFHLVFFRELPPTKASKLRIQNSPRSDFRYLAFRLKFIYLRDRNGKYRNIVWKLFNFHTFLSRLFCWIVKLLRVGFLGVAVGFFLELFIYPRK